MVPQHYFDGEELGFLNSLFLRYRGDSIFYRCQCLSRISNIFRPIELNEPGIVEQGEARYCLTPGCVKAAAGLLESIDETVDPCSGRQSS
jgi:hypothetical protein